MVTTKLEFQGFFLSFHGAIKLYGIEKQLYMELDSAAGN